MAKMFYSLQETAEKLGVSEENVREMAGAGKIQQFRDRDKLMFKRDQIDSLATVRSESVGDADSIMEEATGLSTGSIPLDDTGLSTGEIPLGGDQIDLAIEDDVPGAADKNEDSRMATGISVFDAGEIDEADPHTQTIVQPLDDEEELALESVGSGSGLLDLTQESDDTSLGAELLDEIYPGGDDGSDAMLESPASSSGVFDPTFTGESGASGLEYHSAAPAETVFIETEDAPDPAGNGLAIGFMLVAFVVIIAAFMVALGAALNVPLSLTQQLAGAGEVVSEGADKGSGSPVIMYAGIALGASIVFGLIGFFVGKSKA